MINDSQIGDEPAMVDDARYMSDQPLPPGTPFSEQDLAVETGTPAPAEEPEAQAAGEAVEAPQEQVEETLDPDENDHEAQGRAAAQAGEPRSANPYNGRKAEGRAWLRGWGSVEGSAKE